jgi:hypothetical protein
VLYSPTGSNATNKRGRYSFSQFFDDLSSTLCPHESKYIQIANLPTQLQPITDLLLHGLHKKEGSLACGNPLTSVAIRIDSRNTQLGAHGEFIAEERTRMGPVTRSSCQIMSACTRGWGTSTTGPSTAAGPLTRSLRTTPENQNSELLVESFVFSYD